MSRVQLAINVSDLEASVQFYESLFNTKPHKRRPGYANFEVANPPLKLVLMEVPVDERGTGVHGALNHLGVEVSQTAEVAEHTARLAEAGLEPVEQEQTNCCHSVQDKAWVADPAGVPWEVYTITDDQPISVGDATLAETAASAESACCLPSRANESLLVGSGGNPGSSGGCC